MKQSFAAPSPWGDWLKKESITMKEQLSDADVSGWAGFGRFWMDDLVGSLESFFLRVLQFLV